ncbi:MAG: polyphosphate kinase 1 [Planctomycetota bacterium]|nr:polyphosphate kinase 1 [Planctomycetota bacterium]
MARKKPKHPNYINRELSWLEFNQRVLDEAHDPEVPLLERLKFLAITTTNLDEFFMVRVGVLQQLVERGNTRPDPAGMTPDEQLTAVSSRTHEMTLQQYDCYLNELEPALNEAGIRRVRSNELTEQQTEVAEQFFEQLIYPVMSPMAVSGADEFHALAGGTLKACVRLDDSATGLPRPPALSQANATGDGDDTEIVGGLNESDANAADESSRPPVIRILPFGRNVPRFVTLPSEGGYSYILLEDVVAMFVHRFFPSERVVECVPFRITRNADLSVREDMASDLLAEMEQVLDQRREANCVRLEVAENVTPQTLTFLSEALNLQPRDVYACPGPIGLKAFMQLTSLSGFDELKYESWSPRPSPQVDSTRPIFDVVARKDVLLIHPFESFEPVVRLIDEAADDPDVLAIKQTLYRSSRESPIVGALARAAEKGKYVTVIVELRARFDEARNIEWAKNLEQSGVQVLYGVKGLKTHAKICIIVRREPHGIQRYVHFGTGNYNEQTARLYTDVSLLTCDEQLGEDASNFFNAVSGDSMPQAFHKIVMAPISLRDRVLELIETETARKNQGQKAAIKAKLNSLVDPRIIDALYKASQAGVDIKLNIRGICCLRPGVKGLSENISVLSIVDRFLEHSRILYCLHGGDQLVFISSADWMPRNLDRRVELLTPIEDAALKERLIEVLDCNLQDTVKSSRLLADGTYERVRPRGRRKKLRSQEELYEAAKHAERQAQQSRRTIFEPHQAPERRSS